MLPASFAPPPTARLNQGFNATEASPAPKNSLVTAQSNESKLLPPAEGAGTQTQDALTPAVVEVTPLPIDLTGKPAGPRAELIGMAWYSDTLILLPRIPNFYTPEGHYAVLGISRRAVQDFLRGASSNRLQPISIPLFLPAIPANQLPDLELRSVAFSGAQVFLTAQITTPIIATLLMQGQVSPGLGKISLVNSIQIPSPIQGNSSSIFGPAVLVAGKRVVLFTEMNGTYNNPSSSASLFDFSLISQGKISFPFLESHLMSVTSPDTQGSFWVLNCIYPSEDQAVLPPAERLVEFHFTEFGIERTESRPISIKRSSPSSHCATGLEKFGNQGFLVIDPDSSSGPKLLFIRR
jgi:hypothetical protein